MIRDTHDHQGGRRTEKPLRDAKTKTKTKKEPRMQILNFFGFGLVGILVVVVDMNYSSRSMYVFGF